MRSLSVISQQVSKQTHKPLLVVMGTNLLIPSSVETTVSVMRHLRDQHYFFQLFLPTFQADFRDMIAKQVDLHYDVQEINATPQKAESWKSKLHPAGAVTQAIAENLPDTFRLNNRAMLLVSALQLRMMIQQCADRDLHTLVPINTWNFTQQSSSAQSADMLWISEHAFPGYESIPQNTPSMRI